MIDIATHNLLIEFLIEGRNPYAADLLQADELRALQTGMKPGDTLRAVLRGIAPRSGNTVWGLTGSQVVMARTPQWKHKPVTLDAATVRGIDVVRGKYGVTIGLSTAEQRYSVYGADRALAMAFAQALSHQTGAPISQWKIDALSADESQHAAAVASDAAARIATA